MTVTLLHSGQRRAMGKDRGSIDQIICELSDDLRVLGEQAQAKQDFESFERAVHQRFVAAERAVLAGECRDLTWTCLSSSSAGGRIVGCCGAPRRT